MNEQATTLISVIIPTYNHGRYLGRSLQSVIDQSYTYWEVIIIDNHSTDNTDDVIAKFQDPRITCIKIHNDGVIAVSRNAGIRAAKGAWVAFLDSDDWWTNDKLKICIDNINDEVDLVYHDMEIVSEQLRLIGRKLLNSWQVKKPVLQDLLLRGNAIVNSSVMVRKELLIKICGINESRNLIAAEDYNTWLRIAKLTDQYVYLPNRLGYYLIHNNNTTSKDTSIAVRYAVADFLDDLSDTQKLKIEANFLYASGRFNILNGYYKAAKNELWLAVKYGSMTLKTKSLLHLLWLIIVTLGARA